MKTRRKLAPNALILWLWAVSVFGQTPEVKYFPQFAIGGGAVTSFTVRNPNDSPIVITLELFRSDGSVFSSQQTTVAAGATKTLTYGGQAGQALNGWARLSAANSFNATGFFQITGVGNVGVLPSEKAKMMEVFSFVEGMTDTGIAFANPSSTLSTKVRFKVYDSLGNLQGQAEFALPPLEHRALFFSEPPLNATVDGVIEMTSDEEIVAVGLRLDGSLLSSVPVVTPEAAAAEPGPIAGWELLDSTGKTIGSLLGNHVDSVHTVVIDLPSLGVSVTDVNEVMRLEGLLPAGVTVTFAALPTLEEIPPPPLVTTPFFGGISGPRGVLQPFLYESANCTGTPFVYWSPSSRSHSFVPAGVDQQSGILYLLSKSAVKDFTATAIGTPIFSSADEFGSGQCVSANNYLPYLLQVDDPKRWYTVKAVLNLNNEFTPPFRLSPVRGVKTP